MKKKEHGFTLIEMVVVLAIIAVLASTLTPMVLRHVEDSRIARAQSEVKTIGGAIAAFERDLRTYPLFVDGSDTDYEQMDIVVLQGPGDMPQEDPPSDWTVATPTGDEISGGSRGELVEHLIENGPSYPTSRTEDKPFMWKGPYMENLGPDPWGNKYLVNAENLIGTSTDPAFVLSAGPNEKVETSFDISGGEGQTMRPGGDDIIFRLK